MNDFTKIIFSSFIILFSSTIQGLVGFGFALISLPLLTLMFPLSDIVPLIVVCSLFTNITVVLSTLKFIKIKEIWLMIIAGLIGIPIGVIGLKYLNPNLLKIVIGFLIVTTSVIMMKGYKLNFRNKMVAFSITGLISGILNGGLSMSGPPVVLFLSNEGYNKNSFRANLTFYAIVINIFTIMTFAYNDMLSTDFFHLLKTNIVALIIGSLLGIIITKKIKDKIFDKIVLYLIIVMGCITVITNIFTV
ncbi:sulfite exporter TauE/SafE family protein [Clostridium grantii]|uniref:Probable membrane transporter protein n=1 Tax=Clostridium grantii DSM 8605 TaxID=1121316 RepID=A0A1M5X4L3_9CLOT|nr:sulfite exporter TauE/SafE family protein [Clostridium grantii]SHH94532.1 hypothetical protein SAMN02745207_03330 [Clostridium grantii DSM 8605]